MLRTGLLGLGLNLVDHGSLKKVGTIRGFYTLRTGYIYPQNLNYRRGVRSFPAGSNFSNAAIRNSEPRATYTKRRYRPKSFRARLAGSPIHT